MDTPLIHCPLFLSVTATHIKPIWCGLISKRGDAMSSSYNIPAPKAKITSEKWWLEDDPFLLKWSLFRDTFILPGIIHRFTNDHLSIGWWFPKRYEWEMVVNHHLQQFTSSSWFQPNWKNTSQIGSFHRRGMKITNIWKHHLDFKNWLFGVPGNFMNFSPT